MKARPGPEAYARVAATFATFLAGLDADLRPLALYRNGTVGAPGISDLDFIIVVDDDYASGLELFERIHDFVGTVEFKEILFAHLPYLLPRTLAQNVACYSLNSPGDFVNLFGDLEFSPCDIGLQHILQQQEFLAERIVILASLRSSAKLDLDRLMLFGHALVHSRTVIGRFRKIDRETARGLDHVEQARRRIAAGTVPDLTATPEEILEWLIEDTLHLLSTAATIVSRHLHLYMGEELKELAYADHVLWRNFSATPQPFHLVRDGHRVVIEGLPYTVPIVRHLLFAPSAATHVVADRELLDAIEFRRRIVAQSARFNFLNFGNARGRGILAPYAVGRVHDVLARRLIAELPATR